MQSRQCDIFSNRHLFLPDHEPLFMVRFLFYFSPNAAAATHVILYGHLRQRQSDCHCESPLERVTAKPGGMYRKTNTESPYSFLKHIQTDCHCESPLERGTAKPGGMYRKPNTESPYSFLKHRQTDCHRESPLERGTAKPGGMYRKPNTESPYNKRTITIYAGSASVIHTPPLSWHPFRKGTLPP